MSLILLLYSVNAQALSSSTLQFINGSQPYLTFDNGITKVTTTEGLLGITLSNGTNITPESNTSTETNPIVLPDTNDRFTDIDMLIPTTTDTVALNELITSYNYWGDDDGDGQGTNGLTITGNLSVKITDRDNQTVGRSDVLDICKGPYKVVLTGTNGSLTTQYGVPNSRIFTDNSATYYIAPKSTPVICYARPSLQYGGNGVEGQSEWNFSGPANIWNPTRGFLPQSTSPSLYSRNFPTTGANNLYFDLDIAGISDSTLTWPTITKGGITVTITPTPGGANDGSSVRVTLTGPEATSAQISSDSPGSLSTISLPQPFELVGYDSSNSEVVKYGFELKQWFVNRGDKSDTISNHTSWCADIGYHVPHVKDLTNAVCSGINANERCQGAVGATPSSIWNGYQRNIGAGLFAEWGLMQNYVSANFVLSLYLTSDANGPLHFAVNSGGGGVTSYYSNTQSVGVCTTP